MPGACAGRLSLVAAAALLCLGLGDRPICAEEELAVAVLPFVSSAPVFLAESEGFYRDEGVAVRLQFFQAAQPVALAVAAGSADVGVTGLTAGFFNLAARGALRIVAGQARVERGYDFIAYVVSDRAWNGGLRSLQSLPGHRVGITQIGSTFHYMVGRLADVRGFDLDAVQLVPLESVANTVAALRGGGVDMILLPAHLAVPLERRRVGRILGWAHEETPWQLGALFTSTRVLERRREPLAAFLRAYRRATRLYAEQLLAGRDGEGGPSEQARRLAEELTAYVPSSPEEILRGAPFIDDALDVRSIAEQVSWLRARRLLDRPLSMDDLLVPDLLGAETPR